MLIHQRRNDELLTDILINTNKRFVSLGVLVVFVVLQRFRVARFFGRFGENYHFFCECTVSEPFHVLLGVLADVPFLEPFLVCWMKF